MWWFSSQDWTDTSTEFDSQCQWKQEQPVPAHLTKEGQSYFLCWAFLGMANHSLHKDTMVCLSSLGSLFWFNGEECIQALLAAQKGSVSTSELQGVARITVNVSFAIRSVHLAKNVVFLCIKAGGQHRGVVSYLLQGVMTPLSLQYWYAGIFSLCCNWRNASGLQIY